MALKLNTDKFKLVGGDPGVDFVNTVVGWRSNPVKKSQDYRDVFRCDKLEGYADLVAWSWQVGLLDDNAAKRLLKLAEKKPSEAGKVLKRAVILRGSIYRLFKSVVEGWQPEISDVETLDKELSIAQKNEELIYDKNGFNRAWNNRDASLDSMLWQIASAATEFLVSGDLSRLKQCGSEVCGWMFLDTSRNRSRHWCDMKENESV
jgi:predicted RNA-binding Zn ribbon-like protein